MPHLTKDLYKLLLFSVLSLAFTVHLQALNPCLLYTKAKHSVSRQTVGGEQSYMRLQHNNVPLVHCRSTVLSNKNTVMY